MTTGATRTSSGRCSLRPTRVIHLAGVNRGLRRRGATTATSASPRQLADAVSRPTRPSGRVRELDPGRQRRRSTARPRRGPRPSWRKPPRRPGATFVDVLLPNLFGEHGRPHYNSFIATLRRRRGRAGEDASRQRPGGCPAARPAGRRRCSSTPSRPRRTARRPRATRTSVARGLALLREFHELYATGEIPPLLEPFRVDLFNTYRSLHVPGALPHRT